MAFLPRRCWFRLTLLVVAAMTGCDAVKSEVTADARTEKGSPPLSTGRHIDPSGAESSQLVGHMPVNVVLSHDGKYALTTGCGNREQICATRLSDGKLADKIDYRSLSQNKAHG